MEIYYNGAWGTVCNDDWDLSDAKVVCRSLGYLAAEEAVTDASVFGRGSGEIVLDEVECYGHESSISRCSHERYGNHDCSHQQDAGVRCAKDLAGIYEDSHRKTS